MVSKLDNNDLQASQLNLSSREEKLLKREKEIEELKSAWEEKVNQASGLTQEEAKMEKKLISSFKTNYTKKTKKRGEEDQTTRKKESAIAFKLVFLDYPLPQTKQFSTVNHRQDCVQPFDDLCSYGATNCAVASNPVFHRLD